MSNSAWKGPLIGFGAAPTLGGVADPNLSRSPSIFDQGAGIMDPRFPYCYNPGAAIAATEGDAGATGWWGFDRICLVNQVPSTATTTAIAAAQTPTAGTPLTLVAASGAGITVGTSITRADTGALVSGLLAIDGAMGTVQNGATGGNQFWDPTKALARCVAIQSLGNDSAATFTVRGFDVYGFPVTDTVAGANVGTARTLKAFKYVLSITPAGTLSGANVSVGQADTIGLLLRMDLFQYLNIWWPDTTVITATTGFTAPDTTNPATAATGDVRGTYALQVASNNAHLLVIYGSVPVGNTGSAAGLVGVTQFADF